MSSIFETAGQVNVVEGPRVWESTGWSEEIYIGERTFSNVVIKTFDYMQLSNNGAYVRLRGGFRLPGQWRLRIHRTWSWYGLCGHWPTGLRRSFLKILG